MTRTRFMAAALALLCLVSAGTALAAEVDCDTA